VCGAPQIRQSPGPPPKGSANIGRARLPARAEGFDVTAPEDARPRGEAQAPELPAVDHPSEIAVRRAEQARCEPNRQQNVAVVLLLHDALSVQGEGRWQAATCCIPCGGLLFWRRHSGFDFRRIKTTRARESGEMPSVFD
jgi:hypothetical protein